MIVTTHREGILAWPTLRSVAAAVDQARRSGVSVEVLVVVNDADETTRRLVHDATARGLADRFIETKLDDPGQSRLAGLSATDSDLVMIMDGDDLISRDFITAAIKLWQRGDGRDIIHPEWRIFFGGHFGWQRFRPQSDPSFDIRQQLFVYDYSSTVVASRQVWRDCPYQLALIGSGFGQEDWSWGLDVIAAGYRHTIAPHTVRFYRYRQNSVCRLHDANQALIRPSEFFTSDVYLNAGAAPDLTARPRPQTKAAAYRERVLTQWRQAFQVTFAPLQKRWRRRLAKLALNDAAVHEHWLEAARLEPALANPWQDISALPALPYAYRSPQTTAALPRLWRQWQTVTAPLDGDATHVFLVPWITPTGADRIIAQYARAIRLSGGRPVVILTESSQQTTDILPPGVPVLDASFLQRLARSDALIILARLLLQAQPAHLINVNSPLGWEMIARYQRSLVEYMKLWAVGFTDDRLPDGRGFSWVKLYLEDCASNLAGVFTDSQQFRLNLEQSFGLPSGFVRAAATPTPVLPDNPSPIESHRVVWAGRLDPQKRADRLIKLAPRLPEITFDVWGQGFLDDDRAIRRQLAACPNIHLKGGYADFSQVVAGQRYGAFIYTAAWDGLPVVILEAVAAGLPVVTTDSGGVTELIDNTCGWVIPQDEGPAAFAAAIKECLTNPALAARKAAVARARLIERHGIDQFMNVLRQSGLLIWG